LADWKSLYEKWAEVGEESKRKIFELFVEKEEKLPSLFEKEPYAKRIYDEFFLPELKAEEMVPVSVPITPEVERVPTPVPIMPPPRPGEEIKVGPRFNVGDKAIYRWTGEEVEIMSVAKWPSVLVKYVSSGKLEGKDEKQLVTAQEYEILKKEQVEKVEKAKKERVAREVPRVYREVERPRESVLRDIFYATLSREGVPIKEGYRARWRIRLPDLLKLPTREEQEKAAEDFANEIVSDYKAEREARARPGVARKEIAALRPLPAGWKRVEGGYLVNGRFVSEAEAPAVPAGPPVERERLLLTGMMRRRCNHPDHADAEWVKANPDVEAEFPAGQFLADLEEERLAFCLPMPGYYRSRRFNGYCPYHRHKVFKVYVSTVGRYAEVYLWMFKVSGGRQGLDPGILKKCISDLGVAKTVEQYDHPVTWHPPKAIFNYWKDIGWRAPEVIEQVWQREEVGEIKPYEIEDWLRSEREEKGVEPGPFDLAEWLRGISRKRGEEE